MSSRMFLLLIGGNVLVPKTVERNSKLLAVDDEKGFRSCCLAMTASSVTLYWMVDDGGKPF